MKKEYTIYDMMVFIFVCTVSFILIMAVSAMFVFKIPTTVENAPIRSGLIDLLKVIAGSVLTIIGSKLSNLIKSDNGKI